jgi:DNA-binding YbaB/EbfC family protein
MFEGIKGMADVMKLAGQMGKIKENMAAAQERAKNRTATGEAAAGWVKVSANGLGEIVKVEVEQDALADRESLGPLLVAATNLAIARSKEILMEEVRTANQGLDLPPGMM